MREGQSQSHARWYCRYHVVWVPKYLKRSIFGQIRRGIGKSVRALCQRQGVELVEGHALPGHARREQLLEIVGHDAVIWSERDNGYVLVAEHGPVDIAQIADYVRRSTE